MLRQCLEIRTPRCQVLLKKLSFFSFLAAFLKLSVSCIIIRNGSTMIPGRAPRPKQSRHTTSRSDVASSRNTAHRGAAKLPNPFIKHELMRIISKWMNIVDTLHWEYSGYLLASMFLLFVGFRCFGADGGSQGILSPNTNAKPKSGTEEKIIYTIAVVIKREWRGNRTYHREGHRQYERNTSPCANIDQYHQQYLKGNAYLSDRQRSRRSAARKWHRSKQRW